MVPEDSDTAAGSSPVRWTLYAGVYAFLCGLLLLVPLGVVAETLLKVLTLPVAFTVILVPTSGAIIAAGVWWVVVERQETYTYLRGGAFGLLTALGTVLLWTLLVAIVYGPSAPLAAGVVIGFVIAVTAPIGVVAGLPLLYARRR